MRDATRGNESQNGCLTTGKVWVNAFNKHSDGVGNQYIRFWPKLSNIYFRYRYAYNTTRSETGNAESFELMTKRKLPKSFRVYPFWFLPLAKQFFGLSADSAKRREFLISRKACNGLVKLGTIPHINYLICVVSPGNQTENP